MTDLTVVQYSDAVGMGFSPYEPPNSPQVSGEFWTAAKDLLRVDVTQPHIGVTLPHPVWSLRYVELGDRRPYWCFAVQGRGGPFGPAGTCRFMFAPLTVHPAEVWRAGCTRATGDHPSSSWVEPDPVGIKQQLLGVLRAVALGQRYGRLPGSPVEAAALIGAVLAALPRWPAADWVWSTCLLEHPDTWPQRTRHAEPAGRRGVRSVGLGVFAAGWPDEFRQEAPKLADRLDRTLEPLATAERFSREVRDEALEDALVWLAEPTDLGQRRKLVEQSGVNTLVELLDEISRVIQLLRWRDVPRLLGTPAGVATLQSQPQLIGVWAEKDPGAAVRQLHAGSEAWVRRVILDTLVPLLLRSAPGDNLLGLPVADEALSGRHRQLASYLREYEPDGAKRAELIRQLRAAGGVLTDLEAVHDWLAKELKLDPVHAPDLFPGRRSVVESEIVSHRGLTPKALDELSRTPNPAQLLIELADRIDGVKPAAAARLIGAPALLGPEQPYTATVPPAREMARGLTRATLFEKKTDTPDWVYDLLTELRRLDVPPQVRRAALYGSVGVLLETGSAKTKTLLNDRAFRDLCLTIGMDNEAPADIIDLFNQIHAITQQPAAAPQPTRTRTGIKFLRRKPQPEPDQTPPTEPAKTKSGGRSAWVGLPAIVIMLIALLSLVAITIIAAQILPHGQNAGVPADSSGSASAGATASTTAKQPASHPPSTSATANPPPAPNTFDFLLLLSREKIDADSAVAQFEEKFKQNVPTNRKVTKIELIGYGGDGHPGLNNARVLKDELGRRKIYDDKTTITATDGGAVKGISSGTVGVVVTLAP